MSRRERPALDPIRRSELHAIDRIRIDGAQKQAFETSRNRLLVTTVMFAIGFAAIGLRLVDVSVMQRDGEPRAERPHAIAAPTKRADIVDRNGVVLATSLATYSLHADPARVFDAADATAKIARALPDLDRAEALAALTSERRFVWLRRHLTPRQYYEINRLGIPGLWFRPEERRVYPHGALVSHVLGFTDIDNVGIAGVEKRFDKTLTRGGEIALSLDIRVQHALKEELGAAMTEFRAAGASALILDVRSGEVVGMVSLPDFDPNERQAAASEAMFNRNTLGVYEMGSTFKIFTVAAALETGVATLNDSYDVRRPIRVARFVINDYKPRNRALTVSEIFIYSSNIGVAKMALDIGTARQQDFLARLGLLRPAPIELPEVGMPMRPSPWREINTMTIAYGHGLAVSPLQLASAVAGIANDGIQVRTTVRHRPAGTVPPGTRVVTARTSLAMRSLMRQVVERGTGRRANAEGYQVGGKTGSADKYRSRGGQSALLSSFVGVFPVSAPRYVVLVILDEPRGTKATHNRATGGWVAAPATGRIVNRVAPMLGVQPVDNNLIANLIARPPAPVVKVSSGVRKGAAF